MPKKNNENPKSDWRKLSLSHVCEEISERVSNPSASVFDRFVGLEHMETNSTKIKKFGSTTDLVSAMKLFKAGDILVARRNVYLKRAAVAEFDGVCSGDAIVLRPKTRDVIATGLVQHILNTQDFWEYAIKHAAGTMSKRLSVKNLLDYDFYLPAIQEQSKIAEAFEMIVNVMDCHSEAARHLENLKRSFLAHAFSSGLRSASTVPANLHHRKVPQNWSVKALGEVFNMLDNKRVPIKDSERSKRKGSYPYYGASGPIDSIDDYIFDEPILLLAEDGMNLLYRSSPLIYKVIDRCWVNNHAHVLQPKCIADIDFYYEYLESIAYDPYITGTYQKKITKSDCERIPLPVPPLDEQLEIAESIRAINQQLNSISQRYSDTQRLLSEMRNTALRGRNSVQ